MLTQFPGVTEPFPGLVYHSFRANRAANPGPRCYSGHSLMPVEIILLLLAVALMHAVWNGMVKGADDSVVMASWVYCFSGLLLAPALLFLPALPAKGWVLIGIHFILHMGYKTLLINMYRLGDFSRVFPFARGSTPVLSTLLAIPVAGELPPPLALGGIAVICLGLLIFAIEPGALHRASFQALLLAGGAGVIVSIYTVVDALGVRLGEAGITYFILLFVGDGLGMALLAFYWRGPNLWALMKPHWKRGVPASLLSIVNFAIALWVITFTPIGLVAAVRETSIVFAALIGVLFFKEALGARRITAACIIVAGVALINFVD